MSANSVIKKIFGLAGIEVRLKKNVSRARALEKQQQWETKWRTLKAYMNFETIIDVGANTGQFALMISRVFPEAEIYSFEPVPDCFDSLKANTRKVAHCKVFNTALGSEPGRAVFQRSGYTPCSSFLKRNDKLVCEIPETEESTSIEVPVDSLDHFFCDEALRPGILLKLDVQGYEREVVKGAAAFLQKVDAVVTEVAFVPQYHDQPLFDDIYTLLRAHGFSYRGNIDQLMCKHTPEILEADALFMKDGVKA